MHRVATAGSSTKLGFIDALRGVAALYVLIYHFPPFAGPAVRTPDWLAPLAGGGGSAVLLFFIISAFTLCRSMDERRMQDTYAILDYAIRRLFRIAPLFFTWIAIYVVRDRFTHGPQHSAAEIVQNLCFVFNLVPTGASGIVVGSWTIGVEMIFYLVLPFLFGLADNLGKAIALFVVSLILRMAWHAYAIAAFADLDFAQHFYAMSFFLHLPTFLLGIVAYRLTQTVDIAPLSRGGYGYAIVSVSMAVLATSLYTSIAFDALGPYTMQALVYTLLVFGLRVNPVGCFVNRLFAFYGRISFSVYLAHIPLILVLSPLVARIYAATGTVEIAYAASLGLILAVVTAVALVTYHLVEKSGIRAGQRLIGLVESSEPLPSIREVRV